ncbi:MAG: DUF4384 domain-containing protein [Ignavibacteriales bacterium]|nr:DUF4384 domain-containing protein [Ignavibacteriales bacterium]
MKTRTLFLLAVLLLTAAWCFAQPEPKAGENINYKWAFVARVGDQTARRLVPISRDTILRSGDEFKMMINLSKKTNVYVFYRSPSGEMDLLFPYGIESDYGIDKNYYIPKGRDWNKFDNNTGQETFYILASIDRLTDLESAWHKYLAAPAGKKTEASVTVVGVIKDVKKRYRTFQTLAERPISIAGNVRGSRGAQDPNKIDIATMASEVSAVNFFSKTITIDHK